MLERPQKEGGGNLDIVQEALTRISGIVQRVLNFQRPALGERVPTHIATLLNDVLLLDGKQLQQHKITVLYESENL